MHRLFRKWPIWIILFFTAGSFILAGEKNTGAAGPASADSQQNVQHNRLIDESSPYLLQHATNPVDWYPWGKEAFEKAERENKPVFLSIGYSTCHWCHVMEKESFADPEVAALLNKHFVSVKVDREERPDIDRVYMTVTQALSGRGGWPNNVFLTPDKKPFYAGTYFPKNGRWNITGLMELLPKIVEIWQNDRQKILDSADRITARLTEEDDSETGPPLDREIIKKARDMLVESYDPEHGGFKPAPKFPIPHKLTFLIRHHHYSADEKALAMAENTLTRMRFGGIFDQIGFGFHRYSTDAQWLVPHFEKMLYDQALLAMAYTEAYQATGKQFYARTVREILTYILREMTSPEGGFFSAEDADSEGVEGKFYLWTTAEIEKILGGAESKEFKQVYNLKEKGNFTSPEAEHASGENILHLTQLPETFAAQRDESAKIWLHRLESGRQRLFEVRKKRVHPFKDDKILTDWNGLMIAALAKSGRVLNEPKYIATAEKAAGFLLRHLQDKNGRLVKRYRQGKSGLPAHLDDFAFVVWGLIELFQTTHHSEYLGEATRLNDLMLKLFWDAQKGGLFMTASDSEKLLMRNKQIHDGAVPSGNSVALFNLLRLGHITGNTNYLEKAEALTRAFSGQVERYPPGYAHMMMALEYAFNPNYEVVISGRPEAADTKAMLEALRRTFIPGKVVILRPAEGTEAAEIIRMAPYTEFMVPRDGMATAYVCTNFVCQLPTTDVSQMLANLKMMEQ